MPATAYALDSSVPLYLDDPSAAWRVTAGEVDLFVVPVDAESSPGRRYFVGSLPTGSLLLGAEPQAGGWSPTPSLPSIKSSNDGFRASW